MDLPVISAPDQARAERTRIRIDQLTKPPGSLGALESLAVRLASIAPLPEHGYTHRTVLIGAADHGICAEGVSAFPQAVTGQMILGFLRGTAAINALARSQHAEVYVADFGTAADLPEHPRLFRVPVGRGTRNFAHEDAMTAAECEAAVYAGIAAIDHIAAERQIEIIALGDMGIGNTTTAATLISALTHTPARLVVGRGTGIDDVTLEHKRAVVAAAVERVAMRPPEEIIAAVGGFEIVGLAGAIIACASRKIPVVLDGVIVCAAALIAQTLAPASVQTLIASHRSVEPGQHFALAHLGLEAYFDLVMRLGEGTGAVLAFALCDAAARMVTEMQTFAEAGVATAGETIES